jgi:hypothetical protein
MPKEKPLSIAGRQAYFGALQQLWPDVLYSLLRDVLPSYEPRLIQEGQILYPIRESWEELKQQKERHALLVALEGWANHFAITET